MKYTNKWMVVPYKEKYSNNKKDVKHQLSNILHKKTNPHTKLREYNQILSKNHQSAHPVIPKNVQNKDHEDDYDDYDYSTSFESSTLSVPEFNLNSSESENFNSYRNPNQAFNFADSPIKNQISSNDRMEYEEDEPMEEVAQMPRKVEFKKSLIIPPNNNAAKSTTTAEITEEPVKRKPAAKRKKWEHSKIENSITKNLGEEGKYNIITRAAHFLKKNGYSVKKIKHAVKPSKKKPKINQEQQQQQQKHQNIQWENFKV